MKNILHNIKNNSKKIFTFIALANVLSANAQTPEDALRLSNTIANGTARNMAIGGAMGSLGGDISAVYSNPAGLGFFKTNEAVITPGFNLGKNNINFRNSNSTNTKNFFNYGTSGVIFGMPKNAKYSGTVSSAFAIAINQTANFNKNISYGGLNNLSSYTEQWAEEFAASRLSIDNFLNQKQYAYTSGLGLYSYAVDTFRIGGVLKVKGSPEFILDAGQAIKQNFNFINSGGVHELAGSFAVNTDDKLFLGGTLGIPILSYKGNTTVEESDTSNRVNNYFHKMTYNDDITIQGIGVNLKLGAIYRPTERVRLGLALHSPSFFTVSEKRSSSIITASETLSGNRATVQQTSKQLLGNGNQENNYSQQSAWRAIASGSYVFREIENVKKQRAFITADIEYVKHSAGRFSSSAEEPTADDKAYYKALGQVVKNEYKGALNFRAGAELKLNTVMLRAGAAYYGNPYKDAALKASQFILSGGLGYRHKGVFVDLTYQHQMAKDINLPYRLQYSPNTFASLKQTTGSIFLTLGTKF